MLNLLKKTTPWMVASLFVATSVFAQQNNGACPKPCPPKCEPKPCAKPCPQPTPPTQVCSKDPCCPDWPTPVLNAAYNYPARIQTRCAWDLNFDISFLYMQPIQENMEMGLINKRLASNIQATVPVQNGYNGSFLNLPTYFKPGFKIGMGINLDLDNWDARLEYTYLHSTQTGQAVVASAGTNGASTFQIYPTWGTPFQPTTTRLTNAAGGEVDAGNLYDKVKENWTMNLDVLEADLGRWCYVGTKFTVRPSAGFRTVWIGQKVDVKYENTILGNIPGTTGPVGGRIDARTITGKTTSWGIGPQIAFDTNWDLGAGFRILANVEADVIFTNYTNLRYTDKHTAAPVTVAGVTAVNPIDWRKNSIKLNQKAVGSLRTHIDFETGFGWGTYLDCNNWYMDFVATYGYQVFYDQNMFRHFSTDTALGNSTLPNGNLYIQGLRLTAKLDF